LLLKNSFGKETTLDVYNALCKERRDPRDSIPTPILKSDILKIEDLKEGMDLEGTVRNVTNFGAFIDIGLKK
jgi:Transcriptional accessory protein